MLNNFDSDWVLFSKEKKLIDEHIDDTFNITSFCGDFTYIETL